MKIKLIRGRVASHVDIMALQKAIGRQLSTNVLEFLAKYDGAEPEANIFKFGKTNEGGVSGFIPVKKIVEEMQYIDNLPTGSYPIACDECGNYIIVNEAASGAVFFWDHEIRDDMIKIADSFGAFLDILEPFDASSIKLKPGQVMKAWIDPDFLKGLQK